MSDQRQMIMIPATNQAEIRVDFQTADGVASEGAAWIACLSCGRDLAANPERRLLECPECGYEMTSAEVSDLCERHIGAIEKTFGRLRKVQEKKRGLLWRFIHWLSGRRRTRQASSS